MAILTKASVYICGIYIHSKSLYTNPTKVLKIIYANIIWRIFWKKYKITPVLILKQNSI